MFNETRLLDCVAYGSQFSTEFNTRIHTLRSGHERRNAMWSRPLGNYSILFNNLEPDDHDLVRGAHMASMGSLIPFRFKDWTDYDAVGQPLTAGTGAEQTVQLTKTYAFGPLSYDRPIFKPVIDTVTVYEDGLELAATVDYTTGLVTFTAPPGSAVTWSGEFDIPVRFVSDRLDYDPVVRRASGRFVLSSDVDLIEVRL